MATARTKPSLLLKDDPSQLIDEWHVTQVIWNAVRHDVDERREKGQFILTGSTVIDDDEIMHTGSVALLKWQFLRRWADVYLIITTVPD